MKRRPADWGSPPRVPGAMVRYVEAQARKAQASATRRTLDDAEAAERAYAADASVRLGIPREELLEPVRSSSRSYQAEAAMRLGIPLEEVV